MFCKGALWLVLTAPSGQVDDRGCGQSRSLLPISSFEYKHWDNYSNTRWSPHYNTTRTSHLKTTCNYYILANNGTGVTYSALFQKKSTELQAFYNRHWKVCFWWQICMTINHLSQRWPWCPGQTQKVQFWHLYQVTWSHTLNAVGLSPTCCLE